MPNLLQINYKFSVTRGSESGFGAIASQIAQVPDSVGKFGSWMRRNPAAGASTFSTMKRPPAHIWKVR